MSLYLEKKNSERFLPRLSIPSAISLQLFPGARAPRQEERGWALTPQSSPGRGRSWERKTGSKQVPVAPCGDNQAVEDVARSKQKLCATAETSSCLSVCCSTFGAFKGGIRVSVTQGKAQRHHHGTGFGERGCGSRNWRHSSALLTGPWAVQSIPGPSRWRRRLVCSRGCTAGLLSCPAPAPWRGHTRDW